MTERPRHSTTRQQIVDAALVLFARQGLEGASIQDIAQCANVDDVSVNRHFGNKMRLYTHVVEVAGDRFLKTMRGYIDSNNRTTLAETLEHWIRVLAHGGDAATIIRIWSLGQRDSAPTAVVESLNGRLADFWRRRLNMGGELLEPSRSRHRELAYLIVALASAWAVARNDEAATSGLVADFAAFVEYTAVNSGASRPKTTHQSGEAGVDGTADLLGLGRGSGAVSLSPRQLQVLRQVESGASNKDIACALNVTEHTVKFHLRYIFKKLRVARRTEALKAGRALGLI